MICFHNYSNLESKHPIPMLVHIKMNSQLYFTHPHVILNIYNCGTQKEIFSKVVLLHFYIQ